MTSTEDLVRLAHSHLWIQLQNVISLIKKPNSERTERECARVIPLFGQMDFFVKRNINHQSLIKIVQSLQYETMARNDVYCRIGEEGHKFYILLEGTASVWARCDHFLQSLYRF